MTWELAVLLRVIGGSFLAPIVFRLLGNVEPRERFYRILLQYAWTVAFVLGIAVVFGFVPSTELWPIFFVGALMPLAVFFQWKAFSISVARTSIFMEGASILPLLLSALFLGEWQVFAGNSALIGGFALVLFGIGLQARSDIRAKRKSEGTVILSLAFYGNALAATLVFALATFLENLWAKTGIASPEFLLAWYLGAFVGAVLLFAVTRRLPTSLVRPMSATKEHVLIFLAAVSIILSLGLQFTAFTLVEQTVALPIISVGAVIGPTLVGGIVFKEWRGFRGFAGLYFAVSLIGALIMALAR